MEVSKYFMGGNQGVSLRKVFWMFIVAKKLLQLPKQMEALFWTSSHYININLQFMFTNNSCVALLVRKEGIEA